MREFVGGSDHEQSLESVKILVSWRDEEIASLLRDYLLERVQAEPVNAQFFRLLVDVERDSALTFVTDLLPGATVENQTGILALLRDKRYSGARAAVERVLAETPDSEVQELCNAYLERV